MGNISDKFTYGDNVSWWIGIVEKRLDDPRQIGVCKVRLFGHHTGSTSAMPTDDLPDAYPAESLQGTFFSTPKEGDTVMGVFGDDKKQTLFMLFKLPASTQAAVMIPDGEGYKDARSDEELASSPRQSVDRYSYDPKHGIVVDEMASALRYPPYGPASSLPFLARTLGNSLPVTLDPKLRRSYATATKFLTATGETWSERPTDHAAVYPFNHVYQSESLHIMEFDDSPGAERVHLRHRLGSGIEFFPDGAKVEKIVKDRYTVILGDDRVGIVGAAHVHVMGDATMYVEGDFTQHVNGDYMLSVDGSYKRLVKGDETKNTQGDVGHDVKGDLVHVAAGSAFIKGSVLQWNSSSTPEVESIKDFDLPKLPADTFSNENTNKIVAAQGKFALNDDKDESPFASVVGETSVTQTPITIMSCPMVEDPAKEFTPSDPRYRMKLSKFYQLADMTIRPVYPHPIVSQLGLDQATIICNLAQLCAQVLDPIASKYPGFTINSGFRKKQNGTSQHEKGEAVDIQWSSIKAGSLSKYIDIASWIKANVPFDQMILEHGVTIWLHLSFSRTNNRYQVLTMKDGVFTGGLNLYGRT